MRGRLRRGGSVNATQLLQTEATKAGEAARTWESRQGVLGCRQDRIQCAPVRTERPLQLIRRSCHTRTNLDWLTCQICCLLKPLRSISCLFLLLATQAYANDN